MPLEQQLNDTLKQSMREKDQRTSDVVRMLKTKIMERRTAKGFTGEVDDAMITEVIAAYRKQMQKALEEFEKIGEKGQEQAAELRFEIQFCERFLPKGMDEAALKALVQERITALGVSDVKQVGKLVGDIMKSHKGLVEAGDVKRIAESLLAG
ncbi:MAG TPA: GatB/YqeY domain-containing protein [Polyangia bacterium]|nr:GatB/YqeY domain-containing protein [Polyangia bacterium]